MARLRSVGRLVSELVSALSVPVFLLADVAGLEQLRAGEITHLPDWQWLAIIGFGIFIGLVYTRQWRMQNRLTAIEQHMPEAKLQLVTNGRTELEVTNMGEAAEFEAQIEVLQGKDAFPALAPDWNGRLKAVWESNRLPATKLAKGHKDSIALVEKKNPKQEGDVFTYAFWHAEQRALESRPVIVNTIPWQDSIATAPPVIKLRILVSATPSLITGPTERVFELREGRATPQELVSPDCLRSE